MAETLSTVSLIAFIIAGVCFAIAVALFFVFGIPSVIGDLSGRTARKSIKKMRLSNESSGNKSFRPSETNVSRGKLTATMQHDTKKGKTSPKKENKQNTASHKQGDLNTTENDIVETGLLEGVRPQTFSEATELLEDSASEAPLEDVGTKRVDDAQKKKLTIIDDVVMIHTDEVI